MGICLNILVTVICKRQSSVGYKRHGMYNTYGIVINGENQKKLTRSYDWYMLVDGRIKLYPTTMVEINTP